ncbi:MAG TPA: hypothetical protein VHQ47_09250 [Phycisphaerae bacterium]|nr:hypothetical protein [Phycisphaerae bacterium]
MFSRSKVLAAVGAAVLCGVFAQASSAATVTFTGAELDNSVLTFTPGGTSATLTGSVPVNLIVAGAIPSTPLTGTLIVNATTTQAAFMSGSNDVQPLDSGTMTLDVLIGSNTFDLLTASFTNATLSYDLSGVDQGIQLSVNLTNPPPGSLAFSSDFFSLTAPESFGLTLSNVTPGVGISGNFLSGFTSDAVGVSASATFLGGSLSTPLPAAFTPSILVLGIAAGLVKLRRKAVC